MFSRWLGGEQQHSQLHFQQLNGKCVIMYFSSKGIDCQLLVYFVLFVYNDKTTLFGVYHELEYWICYLLFWLSLQRFLYADDVKPYTSLFIYRYNIYTCNSRRVHADNIMIIYIGHDMHIPIYIHICAIIWHNQLKIQYLSKPFKKAHSK